MQDIYNDVWWSPNELHSSIGHLEISSKPEGPTGAHDTKQDITVQYPSGDALQYLDIHRCHVSRLLAHAVNMYTNPRLKRIAVLVFKDAEASIAANDLTMAIRMLFFLYISEVGLLEVNHINC